MHLLKKGTGPTRRLARVEPFSAASPAQVRRYCQGRGYKIPLHRKTRQPTVNEEALREILRQHPNDTVLETILEYRAVQKARGYLADTFVGRDRQYHPIYTFHPATGRLACKSPNIMNQPKGRTDYKAKLAEAVRSTIVAPEGHVLLEADWKAIEALLVGYFAEDPDYMRAAKLGIHDIYASHILRADKKVEQAIELSWPDDKIKDRIAQYASAIDGYKNIRADAKKAIHATAYLEGIANMSKDLKCAWSRGRLLRQIYYSMAPRVQKWQDAVCHRAHKDRLLVNPFGYVSPYYFAVWTKDRSGEWVPGKQANEAVSFLPQSTGASMLREALLLFAAQLEAFDWMRLLVPVHDSILFAVRNGYLESAKDVVRKIMTREWPELGGLSVDIEMKVGGSWNEKEMSLVA